MWKYNRTVKKGRYRYAVVPEHPKSHSRGYVLEHRIVAENKIGRLLDSSEVVHHINEDTLDNSPSNLQVMTRGEHTKHHNEPPKFIDLKCGECGSTFSRRANQRASVKGYVNVFCSRSCSGRHSRRKQLASGGGFHGRDF